MARFWDSSDQIDLIINIQAHINADGMIIIPIEGSESFYTLSPTEADYLSKTLTKLVVEVKKSL